MGNNRINWIDNIRGCGILLVLFGHTLLTNNAHNIIYGFHMPLFFFLSGLVCDEKKYDWKQFFKSRFNSLVIPYLVFYIITWLYWLFFERNFRSFNIEWWQPLLGMLYGARWHGLMVHNVILWFLPCLFVTELLFFLISRISSKWKQLILVSVLACCGFCFKMNLPWGLNIACVALQFFWLGNIFRMFFVHGLCERCASDEVKVNNSPTTKNAVGFISLALIVVYIVLSVYLNNNVNMGVNVFGNVYVFELLSYLGIIGLSLLFWSFIKGETKILGWLGQNTLVIFAFHQPILRIVKFLGNKVLPAFPVETSIWCALLADITVILCLIPLIWFHNKCFVKVLNKLHIA